MTILEQRFMESVPERLKGMEQQLAELNRNLNDLCGCMGVLIRTLREMDPDYEKKKLEREKKLIEVYENNSEGRRPGQGGMEH